MNAVERIRQELWAIQAGSYAERIRRELALTPHDPELRWALRELEGSLRRQPTPQLHPSRRRQQRPTSFDRRVC